MKKIALVAIVIGLFAACKKSDTTTPTNASNVTTSGNLSNLFSFTGSDGGNPYGDLTYSSGVLYGMTQYGGPNANQYGNIFSINANGTSYTDLHDFANTDGAYPFGDLVLSGGVLYGMAVNGGASNNGTIFAMNTNGSGFRVIHTFSGAGSDGSQPTGSVIVIGSTLYGMTTAGGAFQAGNIFSINVNGSNYRSLYNFNGVGTGGNPNGSLTLSATGDTLFGMARLGGIDSGGCVFSIDTNGTGFTLLYNFGGVSTNGSTPEGNVVLQGHTLYGMTSAGGAHGHGCIFSLNTNGTGYTDLFDFNGSSTGGAPLGSLVISGSAMYGMASTGGSGYGVLFSIGTNGSGYNVLFNFAGAFGSTPTGSLILENNLLYGMTSLGGANSEGMIFSYQL